MCCFAAEAMHIKRNTRTNLGTLKMFPTLTLTGREPRFVGVLNLQLGFSQLAAFAGCRSSTILWLGCSRPETLNLEHLRGRGLQPGQRQHHTLT